MWLATFVHPNSFANTSIPVYKVLCCSEDIDKCIEYIKGYNYSQELEEWKHNFIENMNNVISPTFRYIQNMRDKTINGINISFNANKTYVDFEYITYIQYHS